MASPRRTVHLKGRASMRTPDLILKLREKAEYDLLWLVGVTACVLDAPTFPRLVLTTSPLL